MPQGETLKPREDGIRKVGELNKAVINLKYRTQPAKCPVKHLCTSRPAGREIDRSLRGVEENNKRYQENPQLYRTRKR
jgi:hypothetical protein